MARSLLNKGYHEPLYASDVWALGQLMLLLLGGGPPAAHDDHLCNPTLREEKLNCYQGLSAMPATRACYTYLGSW